MEILNPGVYLVQKQKADPIYDFNDLVEGLDYEVFNGQGSGVIFTVTAKRPDIGYGFRMFRCTAWPHDVLFDADSKNQAVMQHQIPMIGRVRPV